MNCPRCNGTGYGPKEVGCPAPECPICLGTGTVADEETNLGERAEKSCDSSLGSRLAPPPPLAARPSNSEKDRARNRLRDAVRYRKVAKPDACQNCGNLTIAKFLHGHHHKGYSYPLDVKWLCIHCHNKADVKTRQGRGADHNSAVLTKDQANEIRRLAEAGMRAETLAKKLGVSRWTVARVIKGIGYKESCHGTK